MKLDIYKYCPYCGHPYGGAAYLGLHLNCTHCQRTFYQGSKPTASGIIVKDSQVLLGLRAHEPSKGKWDIPGGFCDPGEHPEEALRREVKEETDLEIKELKYLGIFMDVYGSDEEPTINFCYVVKCVGEPRAGDDIAEVRWFDEDLIPDDLAFENGKKMVAAWRALKT